MASLYELCGHEGCEHFVEPNPETGDGIARLLHLCNPDVHDPEADHEAVASGDARTLEQWKRDRPDLFRDAS